MCGLVLPADHGATVNSDPRHLTPVGDDPFEFELHREAEVDRLQPFFAHKSEHRLLVVLRGDGLDPGSRGPRRAAGRRAVREPVAGAEQASARPA